MSIKALILGLILSINLSAQIDYIECHVIQINAQDTTKKHTSIIKKYDENGNLIYENYQDYKTDYQNGKLNGEYIYQYTGNLLMEKRFAQISRIGQGFDTTKTVFIYENGIIIKETTYEFTSRLKHNFKGCEPRYPDNFLPKQWYLIGEKTYYYDENRRLIEEHAPEIFYTLQNRYTYEYDVEGRLVNKFSFDHNRLIWTEKHVYEPNKETIRRTWEHEGQVEKWTNPIYWKFERLFDDNGNLIREESYYDKLENKNVFHRADTYEYNETNRLKRFVSYGKDGKPQIIHEYIYR